MQNDSFLISSGDIKNTCNPTNGFTVTIPGSKSYTNRALVAATLADGQSKLINASPSDDSQYLVEALEKLGIKIIDGDDYFIVQGKGGIFTPYKGVVDVGPAGTTMRFLTALCSAIEGTEIVLRGSKRMHERPIGSLVEALRSLGADIEYLENEGKPPLLIRGRKLVGGEVEMQGVESSQYLTALLLVSPLMAQGLTIKSSATQVSTSYLDMTCSCMKSFGVTVDKIVDKIEQKNLGCDYNVSKGQIYQPQRYMVEGDATGAGYFWGLAAIAGVQINVAPFNFNSLQGDIALPRVLEKMGCEITEGKNSLGMDWIGIRGPQKLKAIDCNLDKLPDSGQTLAVVCACAEGNSHLSGLKTLRIKETDRLLAVVKELKKVGITAFAGQDDLMVKGGCPQSAEISTYDDHRMAMSFALLGAVTEGITIHDPNVVTKSFPNFWEKLISTGMTIHL